MDASALQDHVVGSELVYDPSRCSKLSLEEKRQLVYEMSKWTDNATEMLNALSRQEILQVLRAELGKERKYTGMTKSKIIELLLKTVDEKKLHERGTPRSSELHVSSANNGRTPKRPRKADHPSHFTAATTVFSSLDADAGDSVYCKNSACKAKMNHGNAFCKRCSCCICRNYDDNKDPSLWLICSSEPPSHGVSCNASCHLECALQHRSSGVSKKNGLDGSFYCLSCGKVNDLLCSWRKQVGVARETRRVDILCYRLSLAQRILSGTKLYQNLHGIIEEGVKKLEDEVGPLTGLPVKKARGIVNRLSSGPDIQKLCASALESLDSFGAPDSPCRASLSLLPSTRFRFEDIRASSLTVALNPDYSSKDSGAGYLLWHRKVDDVDSPEPTARLFAPNTSVRLAGLTPATLYFLKVVGVENGREIAISESQFRTRSGEDEVRNLEVESIQSSATNCSSLSNPSLEFEMDNNVNPGCKTSLLDNNGRIRRGDSVFRVGEASNGSDREAMACKTETVSNGTPKMKNARRKVTGKCLAVVPKQEEEEEEEPQAQAGSSSKKQNGDQQSGVGDEEFDYCLKVMRWLELDGHVEASFRKKFLSWYSLRATPREARVVKVFVDTFGEDPESLAGQLVDAFSDLVSNTRGSTIPPGFCFKLWH